FLSPELVRTDSLLHYLQDTVDALNQSNTSVYSINIRGLGGVSAASDVSAVISSAESFGIGGLFPLANETGGRYYTNLESFEPALRRVGQENRRYYLLAYTPSNTEYDGKFRSISVRVDRPNVQVVARRGYFAKTDRAPQVTEATQAAEPSPPNEPPAPSPQKPPSPPAPAETNEKAEPQPASATTPAPSDAVPPVAKAPRLSPPGQLEITNYLFPAGDEVEVPISIALPLDMLSPTEARTLKMTITEDTRGVVAEFADRVDTRQFFMVRSPKLAPGLYLLQMTLEELSGEQVYQSSTPLDVPSGFGYRFGFSSIVPVFAPADEQSGQPQAIEIRPTPGVQRGEDAYLYFRILPGEDAGSSGDDTQLSYVISRDGEEVITGSHASALRLSSADESGFPVVLRLPTSSLLPGTYAVTLRIESSSLGRRASTEIELAIH
ncbi:MAG: VWA domain-containing protein, partial [Vicinamibacteria bacterium]